jgi:hypothetical protein
MIDDMFKRFAFLSILDLLLANELEASSRPMPSYRTTDLTEAIASHCAKPHSKNSQAVVGDWLRSALLARRAMFRCYHRPRPAITGSRLRRKTKRAPRVLPLTFHFSLLTNHFLPFESVPE